MHNCPEKKFHFILLFLLILLVSNSTISTDIYLPSLPQIAGYFKSSNSLAQMSLNFYMLGFALSMILAGQLADLFGRKRIIICGITLHLMSTLLCLFAPSIYFLIFSRFFQALGGCCGTVLARTIVMDNCSPKESVQILSILSAGMAISLSAAPMLGGFLQAHFGWRSCFIFVALYSVTVLFLSLKHIKEDKKIQIKFDGIRKLIQIYTVAFLDKKFLCYTLIISLAWCGYFGFISLSSFVFINSFGLSSKLYGLLYGITVISYMAGTMIARKLARKMEIINSLKVSVIILSCASLLLLVLKIINAENLFVVLISIAGYLAGVGLIMPNCQAGAFLNFKENLGVISGLFYFIEMIAATIYGLIINHMPYSFNTMVWLLVSPVIFLCFTYLFLLRASSVSTKEKLPASG